MNPQSAFLITWLSCLIMVAPSLSSATADDEYPEQSEIDAIYHSERPEGIVFLIMEQDEEALKWVLPRITRYTQQLRKKWTEVPIIILSHGDEMLALTLEYKVLYAGLHQSIRQLISRYDVQFQVCGSYASLSQYPPPEFPDYVDIVPFAPAEIENYRQMEFELVDLELTW